MLELKDGEWGAGSEGKWDGGLKKIRELCSAVWGCTGAFAAPKDGERPLTS